MLEHAKLTEQIIRAAISVHSALGPGFLESIYHNALVLELKRLGLRCEKEVSIAVLYREAEVGSHRLDILVERRIVVELKVVKALDPVHFAVVRSYLRATGLEHGLLLNFAKTMLEIRRVSAAKKLRYSLPSNQTATPGPNES